MSEHIPDRSTGDRPEEDRFGELLERARRIAATVLAPNANAVDQSDDPPGGAVRLLAEAGLLGLTTPERYGGAGAPGPVVRAYTEMLAAACGTTTFIQGQHLSACALIAAGENDALKEEVLPVFASGERICGIAFAHLRRPGPPMLRVTEEGDAYLFDGTAAWFTGWGVMTDVLLAGTLPDGNYLYVVVPLEQGGRLTATQPMKLAAMNASATVSLVCEGLRVPKDRRMKRITPEQMSATDAGAIFGVTSQIFGATTASIALVRRLAEQRGNALFAETADALDAELAAARGLVETWRDRTSSDDYRENALAARAWCIEMGVRAAHAAVAATGGGANDRGNTAQRLFREAMFYTLTAQTSDTRTATLTRLRDRAREAAG
jgi:alkylation response protein AidB-like acyl-CoA dehydrogenase